MKITDDIYYYKHPKGANCNVYAFKDGNQIDLIDTGISKLGILRGVVKEMRNDGLGPERVRNVFHTHYHFDHVQANAFFEQKSLLNKGNVQFFVPGPDIHRTLPSYSIALTNIAAIKKLLPNAHPSDFQRLINMVDRVIYPLLLSYKVPKHIQKMENNQTIYLGKRKAKVILTGGHTEGHCFFHINDEDNILVTGDHDAPNEFIVDWGKMLDSVKIAEKINPDMVFIGHNQVKKGEDARKFIFHYRKQFDEIIKVLEPMMKPDSNINVSRLINKTLGYAAKLGIMRMFAFMQMFIFLGHFHRMGLIRLELHQNNELRAIVLDKMSEYHLADLLN